MLEEYDLYDEEQAEPDEKVHPVVQASNQVIDALMALERPESSNVRWPFRDLDALTGPMAPGNVWFIVGQSGGGKTTFGANVIDLWWRTGVKVYVMPLETRPHDFRAYLACLETGVHPGDALSGQLASLPDGLSKRELLKTAFMAQTHEPMVNRVMVSGQRAINLKGLERGMKEAYDWGAKVVVVDHIDHLQGGDGTNAYSESQKVNDGALRLAQDNDMLLLFTSQLNTSASKGDYLTKYDPPKIEHVNFGQLKLRNATGMIGLFRPRRKMRANESAEEYKASLNAAKRGEVPPTEALEPNCMGVVAMKLRNYGAREGHRAYLAVHHGKVTEMKEADRYTVAFPGAEPRRVL